MKVPLLIEQDTVNRLLQYLAQRPFAEVAETIAHLQTLKTMENAIKISGVNIKEEEKEVMRMVLEKA